MPGPNSSSFSSGKLESTSFHDLTFEPGSQIALSWSVVRQSTQSFSVLTTTVRASFATGISVYSMPASSQMGASSSSSIGREASEMSVSPAQNFSKPPPVPEVPTVTFTPGCSSLKNSAAAVVSGATVLEPSTFTEPEISFEPPLPSLAAASELLSPPHALSRSAPTAKGTARREIRMSFTGVSLQGRESSSVSATRRTLGTGGDSTGRRR